MDSEVGTKKISIISLQFGFNIVRKLSIVGTKALLQIRQI